MTELDPEESPAPSPGQLIAATQALVQRANTEGWDVERLFSRLIRLAARSGEQRDEIDGLEVVEVARSQVAPLLATEHSIALDMLTAQLRLGAGVNGFDNHDWRSAIEQYSLALPSFLDLGMVDLAQDCLNRIVDLTDRPANDSARAHAALEGISPVVLRVERALGYPAWERIRRAAGNILGEPAGAVGVDQDLLAMQMAKGLRFATVLYGGSRYRWTDDSTGRELLASISDVQQSTPGIGQPESADEETLVSEYSEGDALGTETPTLQEPKERLSWLYRRYDVHVWDELLKGAEASEVLWLRLEDLKAALDDRSAIISYFLGTRAPDGSTGGKALVVTRRGVRSFILPNAVPEFGDSPAARTARTRRLVQGSSGPRDIARDAAKALAVDAQAYFEYGPDEERRSILEGLREEGIDHLCIVPHGPLHFHPLHLAGPEGHPLAHDWIVTYLPNLHLFLSRRGRPTAQRYRAQTVTSIGLDFAGPNAHGLPPLRGAVAEAAAVAAAFGTQPVAEADATEKRVAEALENSRFVHLATHGRHNVDSPAFQCMYFTPDAQADGILYAHEILEYDLRGLDLLTLSACDTALGRFDLSDNLRGLPAAMLLSGVSTLVGTLWQVEDAAATRFFESLYRRLEAEEPCLDAFRGAQIDTRSRHREYRDWGAFYMIGDWEW